MPTHDETDEFWRDWSRLTPIQQAAFRLACRLFVSGLRAGVLHPRLRVKGYRRRPGVFELSWEYDGRALFRYGPEMPGRPGPHIVWLAIGTHDIFKER